MKKHSKTWWTGCVLLALHLCVVVWFLATAFIANPIGAHFARQKILAVDSHDLLLACREVIENHEHYLNNWPSASEKGDSEVAVVRENGSYGEDIPEIIRDIEPLDIFVGSNRVLVYVYVPPRTGFIGYEANADEPELDMLNRNEATRLTNGLWMFTH